MRQVDNRYKCALCGAVLDIPIGAEVRVTISGASGQPNMRTLLYENREIHTCELGAPRTPDSAPSASVGGPDASGR